MKNWKLKAIDQIKMVKKAYKKLIQNLSIYIYNEMKVSY